MKNLTYLILLFSVSCITINVTLNEDRYDTLDENELNRVLPFDSQIMSSNFTNDSLVNIYEIDHQIIKDEVLKKHKYTWVHLWRPYCSAESCQNINIYTDAIKDYPDVNLTLTSQSYEFKYIQNVYDLTQYKLPIYVLKNSTYGSKPKITREKLLVELFQKEDLSKNEFYADDLLFRNDTLVHFSKDLVYHFDSIMNSLK